MSEGQNIRKNHKTVLPELMFSLHRVLVQAHVNPSFISDRPESIKLVETDPEQYPRKKIGKNNDVIGKGRLKIF